LYGDEKKVGDNANGRGGAATKDGGRRCAFPPYACSSSSRRAEKQSAFRHPFRARGISASKKFFFEKKNQKTFLNLGRDCFTNSAQWLGNFGLCRDSSFGFSWKRTVG
jgi:hypothetical protein